MCYHYFICNNVSGWQPGIQEGAAVWDEDWDKFEDEGAILVFDCDFVLLNLPAVSASPSETDFGLF